MCTYVAARVAAARVTAAGVAGVVATGLCDEGGVCLGACLRVRVWRWSVLGVVAARALDVRCDVCGACAYCTLCVRRASDAVRALCTRCTCVVRVACMRRGGSGGRGRVRGGGIEVASGCEKIASVVAFRLR